MLKGAASADQSSLDGVGGRELSQLQLVLQLAEVLVELVLVELLVELLLVELVMVLVVPLSLRRLGCHFHF